MFLIGVVSFILLLTAVALIIFGGMFHRSLPFVGIVIGGSTPFLDGYLTRWNAKKHGVNVDYMFY